MEERKKGVQKQLGEVLLSVAGLEQNQTVQNSYPVIGDKGATIGELRIRATYAVDLILPSVDYNELLGILVQPEMSIVRHLAAVTKEKSTTARHLVSIFQARDLAEGFIRTIVQEEIALTDSIEVLFRGNTVCTKAMDHFMKLVGSLYQREVLMPIIEVINREAQSLEVQKEKLSSGDDCKRNLVRLQKLTELLLLRIFQSINHCPPPMRNLLAFIRDTATAKFKDSVNVRHTSVTSFLFLRFFVPAVLNPKAFGLSANMPDELHMRIFTLVAGVLQKLANLTKYREQEVYINALNPFLEENFPKTKQFVDEVVKVEQGNPRQVQRRMSTAHNIQIDVHLAGLVREFEACRPALSKLASKDPRIPSLFIALDKINTKLGALKEKIKAEETGLSSLSKASGDGLDSLLSKVIQSEVQSNGNAKVVTVKKQGEPLPEGATKARQRSGSLFQRLFDRGGKKGTPTPSPSLKISTTSKNGVSNGDSSLLASSSGARPPPSTPNSDFSMSPLARSFQSDSSSTIHSNLNHSQDLDLSPPAHSQSSVPLSSSLTDTMSVRSMKVGVHDGATVGSLGSKPLVNHNLDVINQHRESMRNRSVTGPAAPSKPGVLKVTSAATPSVPISAATSVDSPISSKPSTPLRAPAWFGESTLPSDIEILESQTDYHGLSAGFNRSASNEHLRNGAPKLDSSGFTSSDDDFPATPFLDTSSDSGLLPRSESHSISASSSSAAALQPTILEEEEEEEHEDMDEVVVVKLDIDVSALVKEFDILEKIIADIQAIPLPPSLPKKSPAELIPEIAQLERIVEALEEAVVFTTPKVHLGTEGLSCRFCLGDIDTGSRFLVVMGHNFHEGHLNCQICSKDLSEVAFQWYKEKSYCFDCYKKGHGIRPMCAHCNEPILTKTYTQALGKFWHPDHFCCTVCGIGFPDGSFYNFEGKPYCPKHQNRGKELPTCGMCLTQIADPNYIEALDQKWHSHHFCCDICGIRLVGQFVTYPSEKSSTGIGKACESHF